MAKRFTDKTAALVAADKAVRFHADAGASNLSLAVYPTGKRSWVWRGRVDGKPKTITGAAFPLMGVDAAREWAQEISRSRLRGDAPETRRETARKVAAVEALDATRTFDAVFDAYMAGLGGQGKNSDKKRSNYNYHLKKLLGQRQVQSLTYEDLAGVVMALNDAGKPGAANRLHALINHLMKWCVSIGRIRTGMSDNPYATAMKPNRETSRDRVLSHHEIKLFWTAVESEGPKWAALYRLILIAAVRRSEATDMLKTELSGNQWTITSDRTKNGRVHILPLPPLAMAQLEIALGLSGESKLVFPSTADKPLNSFGKVHARIIKRMTELNEGVEVADFTPHDLRRTARTEWSRLKIDYHVAETLLNHRLPGVAGVYDRYDRIDEKGAALAIWADEIKRIVTSDA